jgi:hypothetical protein
MQLSCEQMHLFFVKDRLNKLGLKRVLWPIFDPTSSPTTSISAFDVPTCGMKRRVANQGCKLACRQSLARSQKVAWLRCYQVDMKNYQLSEASGIHPWSEDDIEALRVG